MNAEYVISSSSITSKSTLMIPNHLVYIWRWPWENTRWNFVCIW